MLAASSGRGRQVIAVAKTADVILMMLDAGKSDQQRTLLERELEAVGIRLNKRPPHIYVKQKKVRRSQKQSETAVGTRLPFRLAV